MREPSLSDIEDYKKEASAESKRDLKISMGVGLIVGIVIGIFYYAFYNVDDALPQNSIEITK